MSTFAYTPITGFRARMVGACVLLGSVLAYAFWSLAPVSWDMVRGGPSTSMIGDGTDARGLLWSYELILRTWHDHPSWMFYGAIFTDLRAVPSGGGLWVPLNERLLVPLLSPMAKDGHLATAMALALMTFNGLSVGYMGEKLRWNRAVTLAVALAFAVNPYTRARAAVHMALVGYYWLPLAVGATVGLADRLWDSRPRSRLREYAEHTLVLLLCVTVAHYYFIALGLLTPWLLYLFAARSGAMRKKALGFAVVCALPAIAVLSWQIAAPLPAFARGHAAAIPVADRELARSYVRANGAEPWNYVTGDIKFGVADINPLRELANRIVYNPDQSRNPHEYTNGIRWSIWLTLILAGISWRRGSPRAPPSPSTKAWIALAVLTFFCAMSPEFLLPKSLERFAPAMVINHFIPQFRVPSRIGPAFHLALLLLFGDLLSKHLRRQGRWSAALAVALPLAVVFEGMPLAPMLRAPLRPVQSALLRAHGHCGAGLTLPFAMADYWAFEETRGTSCQLVNPLSAANGERVEKVMGSDALEAPNAPNRVREFAECMGLSWVIFRPPLFGPRGKTLCDVLGWEMQGDEVCQSPTHQQGFGNPVETCSAPPAL